MIGPMRWFVLAALVILTASARAQTDTGFTYQGSLMDGGGAANGSYDIDLSLWDSSSGGNQIGSTVMFNGVSVENGLFTLDVDFGADAFDNSARWIELSVDGVTLSPRQLVTRVPYAIQTRGIFVDDAGEVGIGTTSPANNLEIVGGDANLLLRSLGNDAGPRIKLRNTVGGSNTVTGRIDFEGPSLVASIGYVTPFIGPPGLQLSNATDAIVKITDSGRVGIGNTDPQFKLDVAGSGLFKSNTQTSALYVDNPTNTPTGVGVTGVCGATAGVGVSGRATSTSGNNIGVGGRSDSSSGTGVQGFAAANSGSTVGVEGIAYSGTGIGVYGHATAGGGTGYGVWAESNSTQGRAIYAVNTASSGNTIGVLGQVNSPNGWAGYFSGPSGSWNYFQRNVGIGVLNPGYQLQLSSNSAAKPTSDRWTISSDRRLKKNIRPIQGALDDLLALHGVTYQWKDPASQGGMDGTYTGMIAQDVERVFPEWVGQDENGYKTLTVIGFEGLVVEALRDLREEKDAEIAALAAQKEAQIADLNARLTALERVVGSGTQAESRNGGTR